MSEISGIVIISLGKDMIKKSGNVKLLKKLFNRYKMNIVYNMRDYGFSNITFKYNKDFIGIGYDIYSNNDHNFHDLNKWTNFLSYGLTFNKTNIEISRNSKGVLSYVTDAEWTITPSSKIS